jgi:hypothetical protein
MGRNQTKRWENQTKRWENQTKRWENQTKRWEIENRCPRTAGPADDAFCLHLHEVRLGSRQLLSIQTPKMAMQ